ncbi:MAG: Gfo/Idh/MocA family oxidoreductase [Verrucomicrobia bacterium]|nr:Gfo/Idh/MocA family oxidoreductase [Verrucomicrobiota bacterium]MDA1067834.1 Gfo/Idh/MocA family oxidoreductase [Verrucomicrobiota bacterium]
MKRRTFIKTAGLATGASTLPGWFTEELLAQPTVAKPKMANDRIGIALVGCGGRGTGDARNAAYYGNMVAVCDVDDTQIAKAKEIWPKARGVKDFRKVMEMDDVDVVICGTVDHWHTLVSLAAMRAGKDVYCEKPLTLYIDEGKHLVEEEKRSGRILQTGTQQRSDPKFRLACELVRNKRIGELKEIDVYLPAGQREGPFAPTPVPNGFDWDMWQGQTPALDYVKERTHLYFRYWWDYSGGTMTDWGAHHNDIALWATGFERSGPVSAKGRTLVDMIPGGFTAASEYELEYVYPNGVVHRCKSTTANAWNGRVVKPFGQQHGVRLQGTNGWIWVTRGAIESSIPEILTEPLPSNAERLYASNDHMENFIESIRSRKKAICDAEIGHRSSTMCHLGVTAVRLGRKLNWDPVKEKYIGDPEAAATASREMRKPWDYSMV